MGLNFYENLPFWHAFFTTLGYEVIVSPPSTRNLYLRGQATIPSDTVCYPAKLMHGHIDALLRMGADTIFYPCMSYNFDEQAQRQPFQLSGRRLLPGGGCCQHPRARTGEIHLRLSRPERPEAIRQKGGLRIPALIRRADRARNPKRGECGLYRIRRLHRAGSPQGRGDAGGSATAEPTRDRALRPSLPSRPGNQPRHRRAHPLDGRRRRQRGRTRQSAAQSRNKRAQPIGPTTRACMRRRNLSARRAPYSPSIWCSLSRSAAGSTRSRPTRCAASSSRTEKSTHKSKSTRSPISAPLKSGCGACSPRWRTAAKEAKPNSRDKPKPCRIYDGNEKRIHHPRTEHGTDPFRSAAECVRQSRVQNGNPAKQRPRGGGRGAEIRAQRHLLPLPAASSVSFLTRSQAAATIRTRSR